MRAVEKGKCCLGHLSKEVYQECSSVEVSFVARNLANEIQKFPYAVCSFEPHSKKQCFGVKTGLCCSGQTQKCHFLHIVSAFLMKFGAQSLHVVPKINEFFPFLENTKTVQGGKKTNNCLAKIMLWIVGKQTSKHLDIFN